MNGLRELNGSRAGAGVRIVRMMGRVVAWVFAVSATAATYYVDAVAGSDQSAGTSIEMPWRTLERANRTPLRAGDQLLLAGGQTHSGQLRLTGLKGTNGAPILISSYGEAEKGTGQPATIDGRGTLAALHLLDRIPNRVGEYLVS